MIHKPASENNSTWFVSSNSVWSKHFGGGGWCAASSSCAAASASRLHVASITTLSRLQPVRPWARFRYRCAR